MREMGEKVQIRNQGGKKKEDKSRTFARKL